MSRWERVKRAFQEVLKSDEEESRHTAIRRLKLVLISDRTTVAPHILESLKEDLVQVLSRYMEVDSQRIQINMEREENDVAITASLPVKTVRRSKTDPQESGEEKNRGGGS